jgi:hypothetical protein
MAGSNIEVVQGGGEGGVVRGKGSGLGQRGRDAKEGGEMEEERTMHDIGRSVRGIAWVGSQARLIA